MTALAGLWPFGAAPHPAETCRQMLEAQRAYYRRTPATAVLGPATLGCALFPLLSEDAFDHQPFSDADSGMLFVADARIDNRKELLGKLQLPSASQVSDAELLFRSRRKYGEHVFEQLLGDYAFALWDARREELTLARDHSGQRPLFYYATESFVAFASMPEGLHALSGLPKELDERQLALFISDVPRKGGETFFTKVRRVEPGTCVTIGRGGLTVRGHWQMPREEVRLPTQRDYIDAFREQLDRAVTARLRGSARRVAAHLSAGIDSSAVAATAAIVAPQSEILAVTAAPRLDFSGPVPKGRIADESGLAAATAASHANIQHLVLRSDRMSPLATLEEDAGLYSEPIGHPCNQTWWSASNEAVKERGIRVLLTGEAGNLTISAGGLWVFSELIRTGRWGTWLREARANLGGNGLTRLGILASTTTPLFPTPVWNLYSRLRSGPRAASGGISLLNPNWREQLESVARKEARGGRIDGDNRRHRWEAIQAADPGAFRKVALGRWGIDERDPTTDRRLAEFCLSLPPEQSLGNGLNRRLAKLGLSDRVPADVLAAPRGYQYADWYSNIDQASLRALVRHLSQTASLRSLIDFKAIDRLVESWPPGDWASPNTIGTYRLMLLRALSAAIFASGIRQ